MARLDWLVFGPTYVAFHPRQAPATKEVVAGFPLADAVPLPQISYLSSSQGFTWNPEIFLPSYIDCEYVPLENRREPVHEIRLTDEEIKNMLPH